MRIQDLIAKRSSTRYFLEKAVPQRTLEKILKAGLWGPSLMGLQTLRIKVIYNPDLKNQILQILSKKLSKLGVCGRVMFVPSTLTAINNAPTILCIYSSQEFKNIIQRFAKYKNKSPNNFYVRIAEQAEICAISAAIQNMILTIEHLKLGSCWLHIPLYCEKDINVLLKTNEKLVALLAIGFPKIKNKRSPRKKLTEITTILK